MAACEPSPGLCRFIILLLRYCGSHYLDAGFRLIEVAVVGLAVNREIPHPEHAAAEERCVALLADGVRLQATARPWERALAAFRRRHTDPVARADAQGVR